MKYYLYLARCNDGSLYTGYCTDVKSREIKHNQSQGAQYTKQRRPIKIVYIEEFDNLVETMKREKQIKRWSRIKKENLVQYGHPIKF